MTDILIPFFCKHSRGTVDFASFYVEFPMRIELQIEQSVNPARATVIFLHSAYGIYYNYIIQISSTPPDHLLNVLKLFFEKMSSNLICKQHTLHLILWNYTITSDLLLRGQYEFSLSLFVQLRHRTL